MWFNMLFCNSMKFLRLCYLNATWDEAISDLSTDAKPIFILLLKNQYRLSQLAKSPNMSVVKCYCSLDGFKFVLEKIVSASMQRGGFSKSSVFLMQVKLKQTYFPFHFLFHNMMKGLDDYHRNFY